MIDRIRKSLHISSSSTSEDSEGSENSDPEDSIKQWKSSIANLQKLRKKLSAHATQMQKRKDVHLGNLSTLQENIDQLMQVQDYDQAENKLIKKVTLKLKVEKVDQLLSQLKDKGESLTWVIEKMELKLEEFQLSLSFQKEEEKPVLSQNMEVLHHQYLHSLDLEPQFETQSFTSDEIDETLQNIELKSRVAEELKAAKNRSEQSKLDQEKKDWEIVEQRFSRHFKEQAEPFQHQKKPELNVDDFFEDNTDYVSHNKEQTISNFFDAEEEKTNQDNDWKNFFDD